MSFLDQLGQGLAVVQREAAKHITPENINRAAEEIRRHVDNAAQQVHQARPLFFFPFFYPQIYVMLN